MTNEIESAEKHQRHIILTRNRDFIKEWRISCSCGAVWTHSENTTEEERESIYQSHLKYFNRPKMETL